jgi:hypothetical protein
MMRTLFRSLVASLMLLAPSAAIAGTCNPFPMLDASGVGNVNFKTATDGSSNCFGFTGLVDSTGANAIPAVAALADATANPTDALFGSLNFGYNGTTWDRLRTVGTGVLKTDMSSIAATATATGHGVSGAGVQRVELPTDGTGVVGLNAGANTIGNVGLVAGSALVGKVGIDQTTPGTTNAVQAIAGSTGGTSVFSKIVANNTTSFAVDASAGTLYAISAFSISNTTPAFVKTFNTAQGSVTCGTTTPVDRMVIPANQTQGAGFIWSVPVGVAYGTAITACVTGGIADADTTAPAASTFLVSFYYK